MPIGRVPRAVDELLAAYLVVKTGTTKDGISCYRIVWSLQEAQRLAQEEPATQASDRVAAFILSKKCREERYLGRAPCARPPRAPYARPPAACHIENSEIGHRTAAAEAATPNTSRR
jgi:hypothetical protein